MVVFMFEVLGKGHPVVDLVFGVLDKGNLW